jgi:hypothetical protein
LVLADPNVNFSLLDTKYIIIIGAAAASTSSAAIILDFGDSVFVIVPGF